MQLYALIAAFIGVFLSSALVSAIEGNPLQVTDITTSRVTTGNISISFQVYDPDPLTDSSTTCTATWKYGSQGYPKETYVSSSLICFLEPTEPLIDDPVIRTEPL